MQTHGYFIDKRTGEKILVLIRIGRRVGKFNHVINLKKRDSGNLGNEIAESDYLNHNPNEIDKLKSGEVIYC